MLPIARQLHELHYGIVATSGTATFLQQHEVPCEHVNKITQGRPHILDKVQDREIAWIVNTSMGKRTTEDSYSIRRAALDFHIPYTTTITGAAAVVRAMQQLQRKGNRG